MQRRGKKVKNHGEAWGAQERYEGKPHGWIRWKSTKVCMEVRCTCGEATHVDAEDAQHVRCPNCGRVYYCNGHIELIELEEMPEHCVVRGD